MGKVSKLDRLYTDISNEYSGKSKEDMDAAVKNLEKEIAGKEAKLQGNDNEKLLQDVEAKKKRLENLKGYAKNKTQIEKIIDYKKNLQNKLTQEMQIRDDSLKLQKQAKKDYEETSKKLADEKYTMTLDQNEYNKLLEKQLKAQNDMKDYPQKYEKAKERIIDLQSKIAKCDLAWKTLFTNKDWDEIQRRVLSDNTRFTRKLDPEKDVPLSEMAKNKEDAEKEPTQEKVVQTRRKIDPKEVGVTANEEKPTRENLGAKYSDVLENNTNTLKEIPGVRRKLDPSIAGDSFAVGNAMEEKPKTKQEVEPERTNTLEEIPDIRRRLDPSIAADSFVVGNAMEEESKTEQEVESEEQKAEETALVVKKESIFKRAFRWFKQKLGLGEYAIPEETDNSYFARKVGEEPSVRGTDQEKMEDNPYRTQNQVKEEPVQEGQKDAFLEGLRMHVDEEYRKAVREEKMAQNSDMHKAQTKNNERDEQER